MTINYKLPPIWMERSGEGYSCICPQCGTVCRTINPMGTSAEMLCKECGSAFRIEYLRFVTEEVKEC